MKLRNFIFCLIFSLFSGVSLSAPAIATQARINLWIGSSAIPDGNYTTGITSSMGTMKILKPNASVISSLNTLNMSTMYLSSKTFNGAPHQSISENGTTDSAGTSRQCVAFAKAMTGATGTPTWYKGNALTSYTSGIFPYAKLGNLSSFAPLQPGTMIAFFNGQSKYPLPSASVYGHVAIFLNWVFDASGNITGIDVVDQNMVTNVLIGGINTGGASGTIIKHRLPWMCTAGALCTTDARYNNPRYYGSNYHVVDVHGKYQYT